MINLLSLNVRGLNNDSKKSSLFSILKKDPRFTKYDIVILQETKLRPKDHHFFQQNWNSSVVFSSVDSQNPHSGTLILIKKHSSITISSQWNDSEGRIASLVFTWLGLEFTLFSVYAPADHGPRVHFFDKFLDAIPETESALCLLGGDLNCVMDPVLDHSGGDPLGGTHGSADLANIMTVLDLEDTWRVRNPLAREFSHAQMTQNGLVRSRIDRWLASSTLQPFIKDISHLEFPLKNLDHKGVSITISDPDQVQPGPGYWKMNASLLDDHEYRKMIRVEMANRFTHKQFYTNPLQWWESTKETIKQCTETFSKQKTSRLALKERLAYKRLALAEATLTAAPSSPHLQNALLVAKQDLAEHEKRRLEGLMLRSRSKYLLGQETPSRIIKMISTLSQKGAQISSLRHPAFGLSRDPHIMLDTAQDFYSNLFQAPPSGPEVEAAQQEILASWTEDVLDDNDSRCDGPISIREAKAAVFSMASHRTPGIDGIPIEFYREFWDLLGPHVTDMLNSILDFGLTESQRRAVISLIYKKGDPEDISNYRPISVLSHDVKILGRVLVKRMHRVNDKLIFSDQTGLKGRFIGESTRQFIDTFEYLHVTKQPAIILLLDQAKAFDRVSWSFLHRVLEHCGFSVSFRRWIGRLYENPTASIKINNHLSTPFELHCGVRQGCPLSPILFCLCIEALVKAIRSDPLIKGISLPGGLAPRRGLTALFIDDTQLHLKDYVDLERAKHHCMVYSTASNAAFNWDKSDGILIRTPQPPHDPLFNINWLQPDDEFRILGLKMTNRYPIDQNFPWTGILEKFSRVLKLGAWNFSLKGRVTFIKTYAMSQLQYLANTVALPPLAAQKLQNSIWSYIWKGARAGDISRDIMSLPVHQGGLGVPSVRITIQAINTKWIFRLLKQHPIYPRPWAALAAFFLSNYYSMWGLNLHILLFQPCKPSNNFLPEFWKSALFGWWRLLSPPDPLAFDKKQILSFPLFLNSLVTKDGSPVQGDKWLKWTIHGICRVRDIWNDGAWMTRQQLEIDYGYAPPARDLDALIAAIPPSWTQKLRIPWSHDSGYWALAIGHSFHIFKVVNFSEYGSLAREYFGPLPLPADSFTDGPLVDITGLEYIRPAWVFEDDVVFSDLRDTLPELIRLGKIPASAFTLKHFRTTATPLVPPPAPKIHDKLVKKPIPWKRVWKFLWKPLVPRHWNQTFFLLLHRGLPHGLRAYNHDLSYPPSYNCPVCSDWESLSHVFLDCSLASSVWSWLKRTWKNSTGLSPPIDWGFVISGACSHFSPRYPQDLLLPILRVFHRACLHVLWRARCDLHHATIPISHDILGTLVCSINGVILSWKNTRHQHYYLLAIKHKLHPLG